MKVFFIKYKIVIFRVLGSLMLLVGFMMFFWTTPKDGLSKNEMAAANIERMEARVAGGSSASAKKNNSSNVDIMKAYKDKQEVQKKYTLIIIMMLGIGFLGYSFVRKKDKA